MKLHSARYIRQLGFVSALAALVPGPEAHAESAAMQRWQFAHHAATVKALVWYPTKQPASAINAGPFTLNAATNSPVPTDRLPLVLISHGTGGSDTGHHRLAEALASENYIVAALMHPGDNYQDRSMSADARYFNERPNQLISMLDALLADKQWGGIIDHNRIGAIGHSIGGYTVAAMTGARPDRTALIRHCTTASDDPSCEYRDPSRGVSSPSPSKHVMQPDQSREIAPPDRRVRSIALLAPMGSVIAAGSMANIQASMLIIGAEHDEVLTHKYHFEWLKSESPKAETRIAKGAGHFSFLAPINESFRQSLGEVARDPDGLDRAQFNKDIGEQLVRWFDKTL